MSSLSPPPSLTHTYMYKTHRKNTKDELWRPKDIKNTNTLAYVWDHCKNNKFKEPQSVANTPQSVFYYDYCTFLTTICVWKVII